MKLHCGKKLIAAGSLVSVALLATLVPLNMGGCGVGGVDVGNALTGMTNVGKGLTLDQKKEEPNLGISVVDQVTNRYPVDPDQSLNRYVTLVGRTVAASSSLPTIDYYFAVVDSPDVNAFSGPHGYVMITRGAVMNMKDESELAGVLGHEIGHICKHHGFDAVKGAMIKQGGMEVASSMQKVSPFTQGAGALGDIVLNTGFSQPQEEEADGEGVKFVTAAGYDPHGYLRFLQRMADMQGKGGKIFSTHPGMGDRIKRVQDQLKKMNNPTGQTLADRFAANVPH